MGLITRQPNRQFQDNMVSQLDDNMDRQKHLEPFHPENCIFWQVREDDTCMLLDEIKMS